MKIFTVFLNVTHLCINILADVNIRPYSTLILFLKRRVISNCILKKKEAYCAVVIYASFIKSNITPVLGEDISPLKIQFGIRGTFTKLFMHVSSRNIFTTTRNLQIRVHVYRPHHCCGD